MKRLTMTRLVRALPFLLGATAALAAACSDDDPVNGGDVPRADAGSVVDTGSVTPPSDTGTTPGDAAPQPVPPGCFSGTPSNSLEFLNACTGATYVVFDNCARLGVCDGGALPALVTPPVPDSGAVVPDAGTSSDAGGASDASPDSAATDAAGD